MRIEAKDRQRNKVFPIRISRKEEEFLKEESQRQQKSIAALIREGYLEKVTIPSTFSKL